MKPATCLLYEDIRIRAIPIHWVGLWRSHPTSNQTIFRAFWVFNISFYYLCVKFWHDIRHILVCTSTFVVSDTAHDFKSADIHRITQVVHLSGTVEEKHSQNYLVRFYYTRIYSYFNLWTSPKWIWHVVSYYKLLVSLCNIVSFIWFR